MPALFGTTVTSPAVRGRGAGARAPGRRDGQGRRHRDVLHLRRPHRRAVVARAAAADPLGHHPQRAHPGRDARVDHLGRRARSCSRELAGKTTLRRPRAPSSTRCASRGDLDGEPTADPAQGELLREGRQAARDRHLAPVVHPQRRPRRRRSTPRSSSAARELDFHPAFMRTRYENWVGGLNGDWLISRQRFFGVPIPVWYPLDARRRARLRQPDRARRGRAAGRPGGQGAGAATTRRSAARPAASSATPTSWTPGPRRR